MTAHHGCCHCSAIALELCDTPVEAGECNCSLCRRTGALWHYCKPEQLTVTGSPIGYVHGDHTLTTWFCGTCSSVTHWTAFDSNYRRMGVNLRMFDPELWHSLSRRKIDGASF